MDFKTNCLEVERNDYFMANEEKNSIGAGAAKVTEKTYPPMEIDATVRLIEPNKNLLGYANISLNGGAVTMTDFKVLQNEDGELFVGIPSKKDPSARSGYNATVWFKDADLKKQLNEIRRGGG
jgi:DNA-binding cell septation regulator SpoVG